jgi:hypothetical protein
VPAFFLQGFSSVIPEREYLQDVMYVAGAGCAGATSERIQKPSEKTVLLIWIPDHGH